jgi:hypothetical protein
MWGNRIHNPVHNAISFQPQYGAPWYIIRNQVISNKEAPFKFRTTDRFVLLHNTIVNWGDAYPGSNMMCCNDHHLFGAIAKNNLWVLARDGQIWRFGAFRKDWRTDFDHDGFDWGAAPNPFSYDGTTYSGLLPFSAASGLEGHGIRISKAACFDTFDVPGPSPTSVPPQVLTLQASCNAVDAGAHLTNVSDDFTGTAPDLGAFERARAVLQFGPRALPTAVLTAFPSTIQSGGSATLSWSTTDATSASIDQGVGPVALSGSVSVAPAETASFTIFASGQTGVATASATVTVALPSTGVPSTPTARTAQAVTSTRIDLRWTDTAADETGFQVQRSTDAVSFVRIATFGPNQQAYANTGLKQNRTYYYRVRAYSAAGASAYSNIATAKTSRK